MAGLWNIYRSDGQQLGPYSAGEIREALRDGSIDPFDQVARVGSKVKQSLVEVDEIFLETEDEIPKVDSVYDQGEAANNRGHNLAATAHSLPVKGRRGGRYTEASPNRPRSGSQRPPQKGRATQPFNRRANQAKKYAKRFYLLDKRDRLLGPLSAAEIQSLFYRGIIDQDVLVSKDKGDKRVPVQQFIAAYVGAKAKKFKSEQTRLHLDPGGHYAYPSVRVMDQISRSAAAMRISPSGKIPWMSVLLLVVALAFTAIVVKKFFFAEQPIPELGEPDQEFPRSIQITGPEQNPTREAVRPRPTAVPKREIKPAPTRKPQPRVKPKPKPKPKPRVRNTRGRLSRPSRPRSTPKPIIRRTTPSQPAPVRPTPARRVVAPRDPYANRVGSVVTIGGGRYSVGSVSSCGGMKCTVTVRDRSGTRFSVVFFRARYQDALKNAGGSATITGRLSKKGSSYVIYLSGVR